MRIKSAAPWILGSMLVAAGLSACSPQAARDPLGAAQAALEQQDFSTAEIHLKSALQKEPGHKQARLLLASTQLKTGDVQGAEANLRKAEELGASVQELALLQAQLWIAEGKPKLVVERLATKHLPLPHEEAQLRALVATAQVQLGQLDEAQQGIEAALAAEPGSLEPQLLRIRLHLMQQRFDEAYALTEIVAKTHPKSGEALFLQALALARKNAPADQVVNQLKAALNLNPKLHDAHAALGESLIELGRYEEAKERLDIYSRTHPNDLRAPLLHTALALRTKQMERARALAQQLLKLAPAHPSALAMAGQVAYQSEDWLQAENHLAKALAENPDNLAVRALLARAQLRLGDPDKTLATLRPRLTHDDPPAELLAIAGTAHMMKGEFAKSEAALEAATRAAPQGASAIRLGLAMLRLSTGKEAQGFQDLQTLAAEERAGHNALLALISSRMRMGQADKALEDIATLSKKDPANPMGPYLRGQVEVGRRNNAAARAAFGEALQRDPQHFQSATALAAMDLAEGAGNESARSRYQRVLSANPKHLQARLAMIRLQELEGASGAQLRASLAALIRDVPSAAEPRVALVRSLLAEGAKKQALAAAQDAAAALPLQAEVLDILGRCQIVNEEPNQALSTFGRWVNAQPRNPLPLLRIAEVREASKDYDAATESLKQALTLDPHHLEAQRALMRLALKRNNFDSALGLARGMQLWPPQKLIGHILEGEIEATRKAWAAARRAFGIALELEPRAAPVAVRMHQLLVSSGNQKEADLFADQWLKTNSKGVEFLLYLAEQAVQSRRYDNAERHFEAALALDPDSPVIANNLAWLRVQLKRGNALELALKANALQPGIATVLDTLAAAYAQAGRFGEAITAQQEAVRLAPKHDPFSLRLAALFLQAKRPAEAQKTLQAIDTNRLPAELRQEHQRLWLASKA